MEAVPAQPGCRLLFWAALRAGGFQSPRVRSFCETGLAAVPASGLGDSSSGAVDAEGGRIMRGSRSVQCGQEPRGSAPACGLSASRDQAWAATGFAFKGKEQHQLLTLLQRGPDAEQVLW